MSRRLSAALVALILLSVSVPALADNFSPAVRWNVLKARLNDGAAHQYYKQIATLMNQGPTMTERNAQRQAKRTVWTTTPQKCHLSRLDPGKRRALVDLRTIDKVVMNGKRIDLKCKSGKRCVFAWRYASGRMNPTRPVFGINIPDTNDKRRAIIFTQLKHLHGRCSAGDRA